MTDKEKKRTNLKIWHFCTSKKLALWLIILLALLSTIGMLIPQVSYDAQSYLEWSKSHIQISSLIEKLHFNDIFKSYLFLIIVLVFALNLIFCTIEQINRCVKLLRIEYSNLQIARYPNQTNVKINGNINYVEKVIINLLEKRRFKISLSNNIIRAEKGRFGIWGATIFHIGLISIIFGGLISNYFSMSGYFQVSEGETFQETHQGYLTQSLEEAPLFNEATGHIGYQLKLDKQERFFKGKNLDYTRSYLLLGEKDSALDTKGVIERGQPFEYKGFTFYHKTSGYSPELKFKRNGKDIGATYFSLETKNTEKTNYYKFVGDLKVFQDEGYVIKVSYFPDLIVKAQGKYDYNSMEVKNPAIYIEVDKYGQIIYNGLVKKDQWVKFDDVEISLGDIVFWVGIDVVKDPGAYILFIGFLISTIGLIVLYTIVPKKLFLEINGGEIETICQISGSSRKYQLFFKDEFNNLVREISLIRGK